MQRFVNYIQNKMGATGAYIAEYETDVPEAEEAEEDEEEGEKEPSGPYLRYRFASEGNEDLLASVLPPGKGISLDLFKVCN